MTAIVCAGKNGEIMFNKRRCSRDRAVIGDILTRFGGEKVCATAFSAPLFSDAPIRIIHNPEEAGPEDVLFLEDIPLSAVVQKVTTLVVYRWDRVYPADVKLVIPGNFTQVECEEFQGYSHDKITREVYEA